MVFASGYWDRIICWKQEVVLKQWNQFQEIEKKTIALTCSTENICIQYVKRLKKEKKVYKAIMMENCTSQIA